MTIPYTEYEKSEALPLHEWLVPYPGFFHAEKQAIYSLCKEMVDGLGVEELASCSGLSKSQALSQQRNSKMDARSEPCDWLKTAFASLVQMYTDG